MNNYEMSIEEMIEAFDDVAFVYSIMASKEKIKNGLKVRLRNEIYS